MTTATIAQIDGRNLSLHLSADGATVGWSDSRTERLSPLGQGLALVADPVPLACVVLEVMTMFACSPLNMAEGLDAAADGVPIVVAVTDAIGWAADVLDAHGDGADAYDQFAAAVSAELWLIVYHSDLEVLSRRDSLLDYLDEEEAGDWVEQAEYHLNQVLAGVKRQRKVVPVSASCAGLPDVVQGGVDKEGRLSGDVEFLLATVWMAAHANGGQVSVGGETVDLPGCGAVEIAGELGGPGVFCG